MYQQYRLPGLKGYLVHTGCIPCVVEWIMAYIPKFGALWFPETKASIIMILWQSGPCTLCTSNIGSLGQKVIWYTHVTYPLLWIEYWRIWPSLGCLDSQKRRRPSGRLWFYGSQDPAPYVPAISAPWVKGLFGTYSSFTPIMAEQKCVCGRVWGALVPAIAGVPVADYDLMVVWTPNCMYQPYWVRGSVGPGAIWYT